MERPGNVEQKQRSPRRTNFRARTTMINPELDGPQAFSYKGAKGAEAEQASNPDHAGEPGATASGSGADEAELTGGQAGHASQADRANQAGQTSQANDADSQVDSLESPSVTHSTKQIIIDSLGPSAQYLKRIVTFIFTSPGKLTFAAVLLIVAILAAGLAMAQSTANRQEQLAQMSAASEPLSHAAQNLYANLTIADASANTSFSRGSLAGGDQLQQRYADAIAGASLAATRAAAGITDVSSSEMNHIVTIQQQLPVYTGLVESARANARQGHPVGVAYLASASDLMTSEILPSAAALYEQTTAATELDRAKLTRPPLLSLSGILGGIGLLILVQWFLARRTGRLINTGLLTATGLMVLAFIAVAGTTMLTWQFDAGGRNNEAPVETLAEARIIAQQARSQETLNLVRRQASDVSTFQNSAADVRDLLAKASRGLSDPNIDVAGNALDGWERTHQQMLNFIDEGDYAAAVEITTNESPGNGADGLGSSGKEFQRLDAALQSAIGHARENLRNEIESARQLSAILSTLTVLLTIMAAICVVIGFRNRLLEYL